MLATKFSVVKHILSQDYAWHLQRVEKGAARFLIGSSHDSRIFDQRLSDGGLTFRSAFVLSQNLVIGSDKLIETSILCSNSLVSNFGNTFVPLNWIKIDAVLAKNENVCTVPNVILKTWIGQISASLSLSLLTKGQTVLSC